MTDDTATNPTVSATSSDERSLAFLAATSGVLLGYLVALSGALRLEVTPQFARSALRPGLLVALVLTVAAIGAVKGGWVADRWSRRSAYRIAAAAAALGAVLATVAPTSGFLDAGRALMALAAGSFSAVAPIAIAERAPRKRRGALVILVPLGAVAGLAAGFLADRLVGDAAWRVMFGLALVPVLVLVTMEARAHGTEAVDHEPRPLRTTFSGLARPALVIVVVLAVAQQLAGIDLLVGRSRRLFAAVSLTPASANLWAAISIAFFSLMAILLVRHFIDQTGRTRLLQFGLIALAVALVLLTLLTLLGTDRRGELVDYLAIPVLWAAIFAFAASLGSVGWVMIAELVPTPVRGTMSGVAYGLRWLAALLVALTTAPLARSVGDAGLFGVCALVSVAVLLFSRRIPESKALYLPQVAAIVTEPVGDGDAVAPETPARADAPETAS